MVNNNLFESFNNSVKRFSDRVVIKTKTAEGWQELTYRDMGEKVRKLAYFLSSQGIEKQDRVAFILENSPEWGILFFALSYIGAVAVPLDARMQEKDIEKIIADSGAKLIFRSIDIPEKTPPEDFKPARIDPDDLMLLLYTSGTTSEPKGVMLTHRNLCANFNSLNKFKLFSNRDVVLSVLPLYHSYPLMTTLIVPILSGAKIVHLPSDWPERLVDYLKEAKVTIFIGVPQIFHMMHSKIVKKLNELPILPRLYIKLVTGIGLAGLLMPKLRNTFGKNLRFFASGGAKLDKIVARDFFKFGIRILEGYGLTETSPVVTFNPLSRPKIGSVGKPIPDVHIKLIDRDERGEGEIAIQGPNVMKGYYRDEAKTKEAVKDGWFLSGDLGYIDKDGYLYITGRSKELIVLSSGKNIYPEEVEKHYSVSPYIKELCVLGVLKKKGKGKIEYLHSVVVPELEFFKKRGEMNVERVIKNSFDTLSKDLPSYKHIMGFTITQGPLPRTILGKLKRYEVEKKYLPIILNEERKEEDVPFEEQKLSESQTATKLIACLKEALDIKGHIHLNDSVELDLGVDSLSRVELVCAIEKYFNIELDEEMVAGDIFTVQDILFKVEEALGRESQRGKRQETPNHKGSGQARGERQREKAVSWPEILKQPLSPEFQEKILLHPGWFDYILAFFVKGLVNLFFRIFYSLRVEDADKIPKKGPYILCVNHTSFFDGFIVAGGVPFRTELELFFIGFRRYFIVPIVRNLVRSSRIIPIDATQIIEAMQASYYILKHNKAICIFPEGERSINGKVKEFKKGIGIIAKELNIMLVPVLIKGAFEAWPRTESFPKRHPIKIKFGNPVSPQVLLQKGIAIGAKDDYEAISMGIREEVIRLAR